MTTRQRKALSRLLKAAGYAWKHLLRLKISWRRSRRKTVSSFRLANAGIDGFTLQRKLQTLRPQLPVVFITGHAQPGDRERALAAGAKGFLTKPFDGETLLKMIEAIIKTKRKEG